MNRSNQVDDSCRVYGFAKMFDLFRGHIRRDGDVVMLNELGAHLCETRLEERLTSTRENDIERPTSLLQGFQKPRGIDSAPIWVILGTALYTVGAL